MSWWHTKHDPGTTGATTLQVTATVGPFHSGFCIPPNLVGFIECSGLAGCFTRLQRVRERTRGLYPHRTPSFGSLQQSFSVKVLLIIALITTIQVDFYKKYASWFPP